MDCSANRLGTVSTHETCRYLHAREICIFHSRNVISWTVRAALSNVKEACYCATIPGRRTPHNVWSTCDSDKRMKQVSETIVASLTHSSCMSALMDILHNYERGCNDRSRQLRKVSPSNAVGAVGGVEVIVVDRRQITLQGASLVVDEPLLPTSCCKSRSGVSNASPFDMIATATRRSLWQAAMVNSIMMTSRDSERVKMVSKA